MSLAGCDCGISLSHSLVVFSVVGYVFCNISCLSTIGVDPITQCTNMRYKNSNTQWSSLNVVKVMFHAY